MRGRDGPTTDASYFTSANRNKRSLAIDIASVRFRLCILHSPLVEKNKTTVVTEPTWTLLVTS